MFCNLKCKKFVESNLAKQTLSNIKRHFFFKTRVAVVERTANKFLGFKNSKSLI